MSGVCQSCSENQKQAMSEDNSATLGNLWMHSYCRWLYRSVEQTSHSMSTQKWWVSGQVGLLRSDCAIGDQLPVHSVFNKHHCISRPPLWLIPIIFCTLFYIESSHYCVFYIVLLVFIILQTLQINILCPLPTQIMVPLVVSQTLGLVCAVSQDITFAIYLSI